MHIHGIQCGVLIHVCHASRLSQDDQHLHHVRHLSLLCAQVPSWLIWGGGSVLVSCGHPESLAFLSLQSPAPHPHNPRHVF